MNYKMMPLERRDEIVGHEMLASLFRKLVRHYKVDAAQFTENKGVSVTPTREYLLSSFELTVKTEDATTMLHLLVERAEETGGYEAYMRVVNNGPTAQLNQVCQSQGTTAVDAITRLTERWTEGQEGRMAVLETAE